MALHADNNRFALALLLAFSLIFLLLAIDPWYPNDWLLENVLVFVGVPTLILLHLRSPLSRASYVCVFVFLCLHEIGAHHTYAEVPYDRWFEALTGSSLNEQLGVERNHFDRFVHLSWGLLLTYPIREIVIHTSKLRGAWAALVPFLIIATSSTIYELIEWAAAEVFGGELGMAYLGTQGDIWDAHKDTLMAILGSLIASLAIVGTNAMTNREQAHTGS